MRIIRLADLVEKPWKNGGGMTREIAFETRAGALLWRLSMADVGQDGPFSGFAGLTRVLTVIKGDGLVLHGPDGDLRADFACPVTFDGGAPIVAELTQGPLRDFNLMYDTARCATDVTVLHGPVDTAYGDPGVTVIVYCITGRARVGGSDTLDVGDTAIVTDSPTQLLLPAGDVALCIVLRDRIQTEATNSDTALR